MPLGFGLSLNPRRSAAWSPLSLFAAGEQGAWYDPTDLSTLFQDSAGSTPVTAVEQPVGRMLDKSGRGNHATQATSASRPILRNRYNLLTFSEQFDNGAWNKTNATISANVAEAPDGMMSADRLTVSAANGEAVAVVSIFQNRPYVFSVWLRAETGTVACTIQGVSTGTTVTATTTWTRFFLNETWPVTGNRFPKVAVQTSGQSVLVWGASLVAGEDAHLPYQRIAAAADYDNDPAKFPLYLAFDGADDSLATGAINFSGTDKMAVFAGVMRLQATGVFGVIAEISPTFNSNDGSMFLGVEDGTWRYASGARGNAGVTAGQVAFTTNAAYASPTKNVVSATHDIAGDLSVLRLSGTPATSGTGEKGAGNFGNYPLFVGRRNNASSPFNGRIHQLIVRGAATPDLAQAEAFVAARMGITL